MDRLRWTIEMPKRLLAAIIESFSLVAPILIMVIAPSPIKTLITSSVAVVLFPLVLAVASSAQTKTVLGSTAAYAAVMVGFVGLNTK